MHIHEEVDDSAKIEFNEKLISLKSDELSSFFEGVIVPNLVDAILDNLDTKNDLYDGTLDPAEIELLKVKGFRFSADDRFDEGQLPELKRQVRILEISINKGRFGSFYIGSWVMDPLNRVWEVCPGSYVEGYHYIVEGSFEELGAEYARLNSIDISTLRR